LRGIEAPRSAEDRAAKSAAMKAQARKGRMELLEWLRAQNVRSGYKHVSQPTAFGTFTLECTPEVMALLRGAPNVASVTRVNDVPLDLLSRRR
jgi:hypothetical protein